MGSHCGASKTREHEKKNIKTGKGEKAHIASGWNQTHVTLVKGTGCHNCTIPAPWNLAHILDSMKEINFIHAELYYLPDDEFWQKSPEWLQGPKLSHQHQTLLQCGP